MTQIELHGLTKIYGAGSSAVVAVDDVSLAIESGELFFLLGPSGCGKTTLLRMIAGLIEPTAGRVHFGDDDVTDLPVEKRNTAMVFQNYALWPHMTVAQNVQFGPRMRGADSGERKERARSSLHRVEMESFASRKPNQLSGGQQQRVALARALAAEPACLLLDEPLSNLDARLRLYMRGELRRLVKATGTTGVYVTHDQKEALSMADRIAVMNDGWIEQVGTPVELYARPATHFVAAFLGEANFIDGRVAATAPLRIETACGRISAGEPAGSFSADQAVTCCIRPEQIGIAAADGHARQGDAAELPATVEGVTFLGEIRQYDCRLSDDVLWKVTVLAAGPAGVSVGAKVVLRVSPDDVVVLSGAG